MKNQRSIIAFFLIILFSGCGMSEIKILVFNKTNGFVHESIEAGTAAIKNLEKEYQFKVDISNDSLDFRDSTLGKYDVLLFMSTSGELFDTEGKSALKNFIHKGGGFVGVHGASTTEYDWEWFGKMLGNHFDDHPEIQTAELMIQDSTAPSTGHLPKKWIWTDEWYNWRNEFDPDIEVLITVDEKTYEGGKHGDFHPISWRQEFEGGRSWYTAIGHKSESYQDKNFLKHIAGGILWASGNE